MNELKRAPWVVDKPHRGCKAIKPTLIGWLFCFPEPVRIHLGGISGSSLDVAQTELS
ncbi:hypothetical protein [Achromobacter kerstersii]|jgi:hypothetical protein|uniref:hypothetical protein n=1 Tax=Achromobacter kerstersii TaxID=1353890 RepID=UPI003CFFA836